MDDESYHPKDDETTSVPWVSQLNFLISDKVTSEMIRLLWNISSSSNNNNNNKWQQAFSIYRITSAEKEQLSDLIRMYPCIWNLKSKAYKETGGRGVERVKKSQQSTENMIVIDKIFKY